MKRQVCPGSGLPLAEVDYLVRQIEPEDREKHQRDVQRALDRGDQEEAEVIEEVFANWERDQGQTRTVLVCSVCQDRYVSATKNGLARRHTRWTTEQLTWSRVRFLMKQIETLQAELHSVLESLEPSD
jgi:hypothetical protein